MMRILISAMALFMLLATGSCKKDSNNPSANAWRLTQDGQQKSGNNYYIVYFQDQELLNIDLYEGAVGAGSYYRLQNPNDFPVTTGTYDLDGNDYNDFNAAYINSLTTAYDSYMEGHGKFNLTKFDLSTKKISGTFEFVGKDINEEDSIVVKSGSFTDLDITLK